MLFDSRPAILVFTDTAIKAISARPTTRGFKISFLGKKSLPPSTVFNGRIINQSVFREALKTFFLENYDRLKTRSVILGLNEQESFLTNIRFTEKPRKLREEIHTRLTPNLPFNLNEAVLVYKENTPNSYQVATARIETLSLLSSVIEDAGFSLKAITPIPSIFPKLVGLKKLPYLFISSEEDLVFTLIIGETIIFSSTKRLKKPLAESEKEIVLIAQELLELEYKKFHQEPLKTVFVYGRGTEFLKSFFTAKGFETQIVFDSGESSKKTGYDFADYSRAIALTYYDETVLSFPKMETPKTIQTASKPTGKKKFNLLYLLLPVVIVGMIVAGFFFWTPFKDRFFSGGGGSSNEVGKENVSTVSSKPDKTETKAEKPQATPSSKPEKEINRADYRIQVLNGSGVVGAAGQARDFLVSKGYLVSETGNAGNFNYTKTTIRIKKSKSAVSNLLTKDLKERYSINVGSPLSEGGQFDIVIIVGGE
jgi:hypothetical protein